MKGKKRSEPATKGDLIELENKLNQKMDSVEQKLYIEISKTQTDVREIRGDIATKVATKDDLNRMMSSVDAFAAEALSFRNHDTIRGGKIMEHENKLENHEARLVVLETPK